MAGKKRKVSEIDLPTKAELLYMIRRIQSNNTERDQALIAFEYLSGARITEIIGHGEKLRPVRKIQIEKINKLGVDFIIIYDVPILKRRKLLKRNILIPIKKEKEILQFFINYINKLSDEDPIFKLTRQRAWQITKEHTGFFNHFFRHMRATHLTEFYGFTAQELKHFFGWATSITADNYSHLNIDSIARKMGSTM